MITVHINKVGDNLEALVVKHYSCDNYEVIIQNKIIKFVVIDNNNKFIKLIDNIDGNISDIINFDVLSIDCTITGAIRDNII